MKLIFYSDSGHGWLKVPKDLLIRLNLQSEISEYSYESKAGTVVYLEEDSDATKVITALSAEGVTTEIEDVNHGDRSSIRSLPRYNPNRTHADNKPKEKS